jgi:hypothetical protein
VKTDPPLCLIDNPQRMPVGYLLSKAMKQSVRQFLKPDWRRILITLVVLGLTYFYEVDCSPGGVFTCEAYGLPTSYLRMSSGDFVYDPEYSVLWLGLVADLVCWYLVSCAIVFALAQLKRRR